ncbi:hypothetical protein [Janibacter limosus]|uniref:hypothetical protein n=1 Tax=Janibacter limosus TaxID=53458 RepID=UPI0035DFB5FC
MVSRALSRPRMRVLAGIVVLLWFALAGIGGPARRSALERAEQRPGVLPPAVGGVDAGR